MIECGCYTCWDARTAHLVGLAKACARPFIVCADCGNKRCPRATDHTLDCTRSNEPGQPGSRYE